MLVNIIKSIVVLLLLLLLIEYLLILLLEYIEHLYLIRPNVWVAIITRLLRLRGVEPVILRCFWRHCLHELMLLSAIIISLSSDHSRIVPVLRLCSILIIVLHILSSLRLLLSIEVLRLKLRLLLLLLLIERWYILSHSILLLRLGR